MWQLQYQPGVTHDGTYTPLLVRCSWTIVPCSLTVSPSPSLIPQHQPPLTCVANRANNLARIIPDQNPERGRVHP
jgi:hypothetical protein